MNIPSPSDVLHTAVDATIGPPIAIVKGAVHVTKAVTKAAQHTPAGIMNFITLPMRMLTGMMNTGFWVLGHLKLVFFLLLAVVLVVAAGFVRTAGRAAHQRVKDTVGGRQPVRSAAAQPRGRVALAGRPQPHAQAVVNANGVVCVRGGLREAKIVTKRAGVGEPVDRGPCRAHNGCNLFQVL